MDLTDFLNARLDEDEAVALAAGADEASREWTGHSNGYPDSGVVLDGHGNYVVYDEGRPVTGQAIHIGLHDPARALREVEAKRKILTMARVYREMTEELLRTNPSPTDPDMIAAASHGATIGLALVALGEVYSSHRDYRAEWKP